MPTLYEETKRKQPFFAYTGMRVDLQQAEMIAECTKDSGFEETLADAYKTGLEDLAPDEYKSNSYRQKAFALKYAAIKKKNDNDKAQAELMASLRVNSTTGLVYDLSTVNNSVRWPVGLIDSFTHVLSKVATTVFKVAGLYYLARLAFDIGVVLYNTYKGHGFINSLKKDGRGSRMLNDLLWGSVNLIFFLATGGLTATAGFFLAVGALVVDAGLAITYRYQELRSIETLKAKVEKQLNRTDNSLEERARLEALDSKLVVKLEKARSDHRQNIALGFAFAVGFGLLAATAFFASPAFAIIATVAAAVVVARYMWLGATHLWNKYTAKPVNFDQVESEPEQTVEERIENKNDLTSKQDFGLNQNHKFMTDSFYHKRGNAEAADSTQDTRLDDALDNVPRKTI